MSSYRSTFQAEVDKFIKAYPLIVERQRSILKTLFDVDDYPPSAELRRRFRFDLYFGPLPTSNNWILDMAQEEMSSLSERNDERISRVIADTTRDVYRRIAEVTGKMAERLSNPDHIFKDSLVGNVQELVDILPSLNITKDAHINDLTYLLSNLTKPPSTLRTNPDIRATAGQQASDIYNMVRDFM